MKLRFLFCLLVFISSLANTSEVAEASLWLQQKFSGKTCGDLNEEDFQKIRDLTGPNCSLGLQKNSSKVIQNLNDVAEANFFDELAKKQLQNTECELSNIDFFGKNDSLIKLRADEIFDKLPFIQEQTQSANKAYFEFQKIAEQNNFLSSSCRSSTGKAKKECDQDLENKKQHENQAQKKWIQHRGLISSTLASLWNGSTEEMDIFIHKLLKYDPLPSHEIIYQALKRRIPKVKAEIESHKTELIAQSSSLDGQRTFNKLSNGTKRKLLETNRAEGGFLSEAVFKKNESALKFMCRLEGKYTKGRDILDSTVGGATLLVGGIAGLISKIPVAVRAGQMANLLAKTKNSAVMISAFATAFDASLVTATVLNKCLVYDLSHSISNTCPSNAQEYQKAEIKKFERDNCLLNTLFSVVPSGILASTNAIKVLAPKIAKYSKAADNVVEDLKISNAPKGEFRSFTEPRYRPMTTSKEREQGARNYRFWKGYSDEFRGVTAENILKSSSLYSEAIKNQHPHISFLESIGYELKVLENGKLSITVPPMETLLQRYEEIMKKHVASGVIKAEDVLVPVRAYKVDGQIIFLRFGEDIPPNAKVVKEMLSDQQFSDLAKNKMFILGENGKGMLASDLHSPIEHDLGHLSAFSQFPEYQVELSKFHGSEIPGLSASALRARGFYLTEMLEGVTPAHRPELLDLFKKYDLLTPSMVKGVPVTLKEVEKKVEKLTDSQLIDFLNTVKADRHKIIEKAGGAQRDIMDRQFTLKSIQEGKLDERQNLFLGGPDGRLDQLVLRHGQVLSNDDRRKLVELVAALENTSHATFAEIVRQSTNRKIDKNSSVYYFFCKNKIVIEWSFCNFLDRFK